MAKSINGENSGIMTICEKRGSEERIKTAARQRNGGMAKNSAYLRRHRAMAPCISMNDRSVFRRVAAYGVKRAPLLKRYLIFL